MARVRPIENKTKDPIFDSIDKLSQPEGDGALGISMSALIKTISYEYDVLLKRSEEKKFDLLPEHAEYKCFYQLEDWNQSKIEHYLNHLMSTCIFESELLVLMMLIINKFLEKNTFISLCNDNFRALILSSLLIAQKFHDDIPLITRDLALVGGISLGRLLKIELLVLKGIDFVIPFDLFKAKANSLVLLTKRREDPTSLESSEKKKLKNIFLQMPHIVIFSQRRLKNY